MESDEYTKAGTTLPDYVNFRNLLFQLFEEMTKASVEWRLSNKKEYKVWKKLFRHKFLLYYIQIKDKSKLAHLEKEERAYLKYYYINDKDITIQKSIKIIDITRKLMTEYGIFNLESNGDDELW